MTYKYFWIEGKTYIGMTCEDISRSSIHIKAHVFSFMNEGALDRDMSLNSLCSPYDNAYNRRFAGVGHGHISS
jgi:hypothetical protein